LTYRKFLKDSVLESQQLEGVKMRSLLELSVIIKRGQKKGDIIIDSSFILELHLFYRRLKKTQQKMLLAVKKN